MKRQHSMNYRFVSGSYSSEPIHIITGFMLLLRILFQFQHVLIKIRHEQPILNNTIFFKFSFSFCLGNLSSDFACILKNISVVPPDPLPNPDKQIQYALMNAFPSLKDNSSQHSHHFLQSCLPALLPK